MLIIAFSIFRPEGHRKPRSGVGSLSLAECLVGSELGTFSIFLLSFQNAQNTQNGNEKARILVDNPSKVKSNIFSFFKNVESDLRSCQISVVKVLVK